MKIRKKSIKSFFIMAVIIVITIQTLFYVSFLILGGVFDHNKIVAYENFTNVTDYRRAFLEQEMKTRWTNFNPYLARIDKNISDAEINQGEGLELATEGLLEILRGNGVTGAYIILGKPGTLNKSHESIYLRNYDPLTPSHLNDNIYLRYGDSEIAKKYSLPLDANWQEKFTLREENKEFFIKPYVNASPSVDPKHIGYWSQPFRLAEGDIEIISYSMPLEDKTGESIGIIGIELSTNYLSKLLPAHELEKRDSLGYIIAKRNPNNEKIYPMLLTQENQESFISGHEALKLGLVDEERNIYKLENQLGKSDIYLVASKFDIYPYKSPYEEEWYIIGFKRGENLLLYVNKFSLVLRYSILATLIFGVFVAIVGGIQMSKPLLDLVEQVVNTEERKDLLLKPTDVLELDQLSEAIMKTNRSMVDAASRISRIIEMVELPLTVFEINKTTGEILVTENFLEFFKGMRAREGILESKENFCAFLELLKSLPEAGEDKVYKIITNKERWIKIKTRSYGERIYGVIQDVTSEILEKRRIRQERDLDPLTKIPNRERFRLDFIDWYREKGEGEAALVMFDIDDLKDINDNYGHKWGDYYIKETVRQLETIAARDNYKLGRRSGDEFIMLLYNFYSKDKIRDKINSFYNSLEDHYLDFPNGEKRKIEISAGLKWIGQPDKSYEELLESADHLMYFAKEYNKGHYSEKKDMKTHGNWAIVRS